MNSRLKVSIVIFVILGAVALIATTSLSGSAVYYYTVEQYLDRREEIGDRFISLKGTVVPGTINYDPMALQLRFDLQKNGRVVTVVRNGLKPDVLNDDIEVVADGRMQSDGIIFQAKKLTVKCPSRYIGADQVDGTEQDGRETGR